jgi:hypothetical protein
MAHPGGRPLKFQTPEDLEAKGLEYIKLCESAGRPMTITGMAIHLDTSRETLMDYQERDQFSDTVKKLKSYCEDYAEQSMYIGKNPAGAIFALKNFGWRDRTEQDLRVKEFPTPILGGGFVPSDNSNPQDSKAD